MFMKNKFLAGLCLMGTLAFPPAAIAQEITVTHAQGEVTLTGVPETVLAQDWALVDNLDALGVTIAGVPGSNAPEYLSKFTGDEYIKTGTLQEPEFETIAGADADLMIVAARSRTSQPQLNELVPTIDMSVDNENLIAGVKENLTKLGEIFGAQERAAELVANLDKKVERTRAAAVGKGTAMTLVVNGGRIGVYGPASRTSWLQNEVGFEAIASDVDDSSHAGDGASFEYILESNPDWLFVVDRDAGVNASEGGTAQSVLDNELVRQTIAWQNDQIVYLEPTRAYVVMHGYTALSDLLDQVYDAVSAAD